LNELLQTLQVDGAQALTLGEQAILATIFALGAFIRNDPNAEVFYNNTQAVALRIFAETTVESTTLAFLTSLYQFTTGRISAAWTTFSLVVRIAQALGCIIPLSV